MDIILSTHSRIFSERMKSELPTGHDIYACVGTMKTLSLDFNVVSPQGEFQLDRIIK